MTHCSFGATQATQQRGRVSAKVRYGPVQLVLDVPPNEVLAVWAANPHKQQVASVVFFDANGGQPVETLRLPAAYCIRYHEQFSSSDVSGGAYQCVLTLSDPAGWTIQAGGPARAYVAPAARSYAGVAGAAAAVASAVGIGGARGAAPVSAVGIGGAMGTAGPRTLVHLTDVPPHLGPPTPSANYKKVHLTPAEWQTMIANRWDEDNNKIFFTKHRNTEFTIAGDPFPYCVGANGKMAAVYDAQTQKSYNVTGTRKGLLRIPLTLKGQPTYAGTAHMMPVTGKQKNVVQIKMAGNRAGDFRAANKKAGLSQLLKTQGRDADEAPIGYVWHHRDDFKPKRKPNPPYGTCTMELVAEKAHQDTFVHKGSCDQCNKRFPQPNKKKLYN